MNIFSLNVPVSEYNLSFHHLQPKQFSISTNRELDKGHQEDAEAVQIKPSGPLVRWGSASSLEGLSSLCVKVSTMAEVNGMVDYTTDLSRKSSAYCSGSTMMEEWLWVDGLWLAAPPPRWRCQVKERGRQSTVHVRMTSRNNSPLCVLVESRILLKLIKLFLLLSWHSCKLTVGGANNATQLIRFFFCLKTIYLHMVQSQDKNQSNSFENYFPSTAA